ncbi:MAG: hypothetical protein WA210_01035 [Burkholderiaceae bacterium]
MMIRQARAALRMHFISLLGLGLSAAALLAPGGVRAEPYLAMRSGAKCVACHVNPTGGGKRNEFGAIYGQTALPRERLDPSSGASTPAGAAPAQPWSGQLGDHFALGGDLRATAQGEKIPGADSTTAFDRSRAQLYVEVKAIKDRLTFYVDEQIAPGAANNRESYAMLWFANRSAYVKAGRIFIPFGLRIEDDTAFIRQVPGVSFKSSDDGVEGGLELGPWSASVSVTNGEGGAAETNRGKLISTLASYVRSDWRVGLSASSNFHGAADQRMQSVFAGLRAGLFSGLASVVFVTDEATPIGRLRQRAALVEGNLEIARGQNFKLSYEYHDPDVKVREDQRVRLSAVWEFVPFQFTQFRLGARKSDGIPQNRALHKSELFAQWHAFF